MCTQGCHTLAAVVDAPCQHLLRHARLCWSRMYQQTPTIWVRASGVQLLRDGSVLGRRNLDSPTYPHSLAPPPAHLFPQQQATRHQQPLLLRGRATTAPRSTWSLLARPVRQWRTAWVCRCRPWSSATRRRRVRDSSPVTCCAWTVSAAAAAWSTSSSTCRTMLIACGIMYSVSHA